MDERRMRMRILHGGCGKHRTIHEEMLDNRDGGMKFAHWDFYGGGGRMHQPAFQ